MSDPIVQPPLYFSQDDQHIWCAQFHPHQNILATTLINGKIQILQYNSQEVNCLASITDCHRKSVRWCSFNPTGTLLATCSQDKRIGFIDANGKIAHKIKKAHQQPINRVQFINQHVAVSGDDQGVIKVWDLRSSDCVFQANQQSQAITGFYFDQQYTNIVASCLDGTVAIYDLKQGIQSTNKLYAISDSTDQQLNGIIALKHGKYLLCPSLSTRSVMVFKRNDIGAFVDRIQQGGQNQSIDALLKIDQHTFLTGSSHGFVRGYGLYPNKMLQEIGQHQQDVNFPVQSLALSHCKNIVASTSHDNSIKFYDVSYFVKSRSQRVQQQEGEEQPVYMMGQRVKEEESDVFEDDSDQDDSDSQSQEKPKKKTKKKANIKERQTEIKRENTKKFFKDM